MNVITVPHPCPTCPNSPARRTQTLTHFNGASPGTMWTFNIQACGRLFDIYSPPINLQRL